MGRATDPGENRDPGNDDQHLARVLTQAPRLENSLHPQPTFGANLKNTVERLRRWLIAECELEKLGPGAP
jgi:hypothetical protein